MRTRLDDPTRVRVAKTLGVACIGFGLMGILTFALLGEWEDMVDDAVVHMGVQGAGFGALALLVLPKRPRNGAVWTLALSAAFAAIYTASAALELLIVTAITDLTVETARGLSMSELPLGVAIASWPSNWSWVPALFLIPTVGLLWFPEGELVSPRWRWIGWLGVAAITVVTVTNVWVFHPQSTVDRKDPEGHADFPARAEWLIDQGMVLIAVSSVLSVLSLVHRYRRSPADVRRQIRLIGLGGVGLITGLLTSVYGLLVGEVLLILMFAVAVLKYRLYGIDVVISKSVTYLILAAVITAIFAAVVALPTVIIGESDGALGLLLPIVATAIVAVLFEPIRSKTARWANRLVYGERATPHEVLSQLTARLADTGQDSGTNDLARLLAEGTGANHAAVWLQAGESLVQEGRWPVDEIELRSQAPEKSYGEDFSLLTSIRHGDQVLGALSVTKPRNDPLTSADRELVADVAGGAGLMLRNIGLNRELEERAEQVRESRRRLIAAQDAERRRLERDLHDGAQQQVVALKVKLGLAKTLATRAGADNIAALVSALADDTQHAVDALRAVAHGIYPPLLEAEGLEVALRAVERSSTRPLVLEIAGLTRYERHVEETVYFCVLDAVERVHMSGATIVRVRLTDVDDELVVRIDHDGRITEADLTSMSDRVEAFGGTTTIERRLGELFRITNQLPAGVPATVPA